MRILFVHENFPGPFRHLAAQLALDSGNTVLFLSERGRLKERISRVSHISMAPPAKPSIRRPEYVDSGFGEYAQMEFISTHQHSLATANALLKLRKKGFIPDIVITSSGGTGLYIRDIYPQAFEIVYAEWFNTPDVNHTFFTRGKARHPSEFALARIHNLFQGNALLDCDMAITFSNWQKAQYPQCVAQRIHVLPEGVDTNYFSPVPGYKFVIDGCDLSQVDELVTFVGRSTEAYRGFPQFWRCLPRLLRLRPRCHVLIMSPGIEIQNTESMPSMDASRVHLLGFRPAAEYRKMLRASSVHVYLTAPFVLSMGLYEAMSCGCLVVGSATEPVKELLRHGENGFLCDFWDTEAMADIVADLLARAPRLTFIRQAARLSMLHEHSLSELAPKHARFLMDSYRAWQNAAEHSRSQGTGTSGNECRLGTAGVCAASGAVPSFE